MVKSEVAGLVAAYEILRIPLYALSIVIAFRPHVPDPSTESMKALTV